MLCFIMSTPSLTVLRVLIEGSENVAGAIFSERDIYLKTHDSKTRVCSKKHFYLIIFPSKLLSVSVAYLFKIS